jgi:hypothetical protein
MVLSGTLPQPLNRGSVFRYGGYSIEAERGALSCWYEVDGREFTERVTLPGGPRWHTEAARAAARLVFLLAGVSYYKTAAPPVIDFGETELTETELAFLREYYLQGLGEFAYRNALDLTSLRFDARSISPGGTTPPTPPARGGGKPPHPPPWGGPIPPDPPWGGPIPPDPPWGGPIPPDPPGTRGGPWSRSAAGSTRS